MAKPIRLPKDERGDIERVLKAAKLPISEHNDTGFVVRQIPSSPSGKDKGFLTVRWNWAMQIASRPGREKRDDIRDKRLASAAVALARAGIDVELVKLGSTPRWKIENRGPIPRQRRLPTRRKNRM